MALVREIAGLRAYRDYEKIVTQVTIRHFQPMVGLPLNYLTKFPRTQSA